MASSREWHQKATARLSETDRKMRSTQVDQTNERNNKKKKTRGVKEEERGRVREIEIEIERETNQYLLVDFMNLY